MIFIIFLFSITLNWFTTLIGSSFVFLTNKNNKNIISIALGSSAGIMIAASFFSLLLPAINMLENSNKFHLLIIPIGFSLGVLFLFLCDKLLPHEHMLSHDKEGVSSSLSQKQLLLLAMTLHNIPEGFAVGVAFSTAQNDIIPALILSLGIAIQNIPEGTAISVPLHSKGYSKMKSFMLGQFSGTVEIPAALFGYIFASSISDILPLALSFAAGSMLFVCVEELIPEATIDKIDIGALSCMIGFVLMMMLDIMLS